MLFNLSVQFLTNSMLSAFMLSQLLPGRATGCPPGWGLAGQNFAHRHHFALTAIQPHPTGVAVKPSAFCFLCSLWSCSFGPWMLGSPCGLCSTSFSFPPPSFPRTAPAWEPAAAPSQGNPRLILCRILLLPSFIPPPAF